MEHETDTGTTRELVHGKVVCVTVNCAPEFGSEFRNDRQHHAARALVPHNASKCLQFSSVLLKLRGDTLFDIR